MRNKSFPSNSSGPLKFAHKNESAENGSPFAVSAKVLSNFASLALCVFAFLAITPTHAAETCETPSVASCSPGSSLEEFVGKAGTPVAGLHFITACTTEFPLLLANNFERTGQKVPIFPDTATSPIATLKALDRFKLLLNTTGSASHFYTVLDQEKALLGGPLFIQATPQKACRESATGVRLALPAPLAADGLVTDAVSQCPAKTIPVWRLLKQPLVAFSAVNALTYPQHRLLTDYTVAMAQQADVSGFWKVEGVRGCAPDEYARGSSTIAAVDTSTGAPITTLKIGTSFTANVMVNPPADNWSGVSTLPSKTIVNVFLPLGIGFSGTYGDYPTACAPPVAVLGGQTVSCAIPRASSAALLKMVLTVEAAFQPTTTELAGRTIKVALASAGPDGATLGTLMSAQGCTANAVPQTSCSNAILPVPSAPLLVKVLGVIAPSQINKIVGVDSTEPITCENSAVSTLSASNVRCVASGLPSGVTFNCALSLPTTLAPGAKANCDLRIAAGTPALSQPITFAVSADGFPTQTANSQLVVASSSAGGSVGGNGTINFSRPTNVVLKGPATLSGGEITGSLSFDVTYPGVVTNAVFYPQYQTANGWADATPGPVVYAVQIDGSSTQQSAPFSVPQSALGGAATITMRICAISAVGANPPTCGTPNVVSGAPYAAVSFSQATMPLTLRIVNPPSTIPVSGQFTYNVVNGSTSATGSNLVCSASNAVSGYSISCGASPSALSGNGSSQCTCQVTGSASPGAAATTVTLSASAQTAAGATVSANPPAYAAMPGAAPVPPSGTVNLSNVAIAAPSIAASGPQLALSTTVTPTGTSGNVSVSFYVQDRSLGATSLDWVSVGGANISLSNGVSSSASATYTPSGSTIPTSIAVRACVIDVANAFQQGACANGGVAGVVKLSGETVYSLLPPANVQVTWTNPAMGIRVGTTASWVLQVSPPNSGTSPSGALMVTIAVPTNLAVDGATDRGCSLAGTLLYCTLQTSSDPVFATPRRLDIVFTPLPGSGGTAVRPVALVSNVQAGAVNCANGASGSNCATANTLVPTFFDFAVPAARSITSAPAAGNPAQVNCTVNNGTGFPVPVQGSAPACRAVVTLTDNSSQVIDVPFNASSLGTTGATVGQTTAGSQTTISVCANGSSASASQCGHFSLANIKQIDAEVTSVPGLDNDLNNNKTTGVYIATSTVPPPSAGCTSGPVDFARGPYSGLTTYGTPSSPINTFMGHTASFEFTSGPRFVPYLFASFNDQSAVSGKEFWVSNCPGDFNPATAQPVPYADLPENTHGDTNLRIYTDAAAFAVAPLGKNVLIPPTGRFYINMRTKWCGAPGVGGDRCRVFFSFAGQS